MSRVRTWSLVVLSASVVGLAGCSSSVERHDPTTTTDDDPAHDAGAGPLPGGDRREGADHHRAARRPLPPSWRART